MRRVIAGIKKIRPFKAVFDTTKAGSASNHLDLPLAGTTGLVIDWGDGSITIGAISHNYTVGGIYTVKILAGNAIFRYNNIGDKLKLLEIFSFGETTRYTRDAFSGCSNLVLDNVTDVPIFYEGNSKLLFFKNCTSLVKVNNFNKWDFNFGGSMSQMFAGCVKLNMEIDITVPESDLYGMFSGCVSLDSPVTINAPNCTTLQDMFNGCTSLNKNVTIISSALLKNMSGMFRFASKFNSPLIITNYSGLLKVTDMFELATNFNQPIVFNPAPNLIDINQTFRNARDMNQSSIGNWDISNVTSMGNFMLGKTPTTLSATVLDSILIGWAAQSVKPNISINFGTAKRTAASNAAYTTLTTSPNNWVITHGGI